jgi:hypothetical protein
VTKIALFFKFFLLLLRKGQRRKTHRVCERARCIVIDTHTPHGFPSQTVQEMCFLYQSSPIPPRSSLQAEATPLTVTLSPVPASSTFRRAIPAIVIVVSQISGMHFAH